ncbi:LysR family transcriptional regulator [Auraticoccus monumenti]|nr:LysR family transcriptional regulator [Auraticoccus monumenti]
MDTDALRWFQQVADGVTVTEVSELEGVSQPGVSRALRRLETQVGTPLLHRSGRTLRMTRAGSAFKRHVDAVLHQLDDGLAAVNQVVEPDTGTVALAFQVSLGAWLVPDLLGSFRSERPQVQFTLNQVRDEDVATVLAAGRADLVLCTVRSQDRDVHHRRLLDEPLRLAVPAGHALAGRSQVRLTDAAAESFLALPRSASLRLICDELCRSAGFVPTIALECDDLHTLRGLVAAGLGVALLPASGRPPAGAPVERLRYLDLVDVRAFQEIGLLWPAERQLLPAAELFRQHVLDRGRAGRLVPTS